MSLKDDGKVSHKDISINTSLKDDGKVSHIDVNELDKLLEKEKQDNKGAIWIKLDKTERIQRLQDYAEVYSKENKMNSKEEKALRLFFKLCLDKNKLNKAKDVNYNKAERRIISIPALHFNTVTKNYTLKIMDSKRVSTLKSLTPKKKSLTNKEDLKKEDKESSK